MGVQIGLLMHASLWKGHCKNNVYVHLKGCQGSTQDDCEITLRYPLGLAWVVVCVSPVLTES